MPHPKKGGGDRSILDRLNIRKMRKEEVGFAIELAADEGWNPGIHDGRCFYVTDPGGFFIAELEDEPMGCISAVSYGGSFGFLGLFIVEPEFRGQGIGSRLWKKGLSYLEGHNIGLDGVLEQQEYYLREGFKLAYCSVRYEGMGGGAMSEGVVDLSDVPFDELVEYDSTIFSEPRGQFLRCWVNQPEGAALAVLEGEKLAGYGVVRKCRIGYKIAPLFANSDSIAEELFVALKARVPDQPIFLDVPLTNPSAISLARRHNMNVVFETVRMYTGEAPPIPMNQVYGVTSFELG